MNVRLIIAALIALTGITFATASRAEDDNEVVDDDAKAARAASVSITDAIDAAEQEKGGTAFEASADDKRFNNIWEVTVGVGQDVFEVEVNMNNGNVEKSRKEKNDKPVQLSMPLADLLAAAEQAQSGIAYDIDCDDDQGDILCEVDVINDADENWELVVDGTTGEVLSSTQDR